MSGIADGIGQNIAQGGLLGMGANMIAQSYMQKAALNAQLKESQEKYGYLNHAAALQAQTQRGLGMDQVFMAQAMAGSSVKNSYYASAAAQNIANINARNQQIQLQQKIPYMYNMELVHENSVLAQLQANNKSRIDVLERMLHSKQLGDSNLYTHQDNTNQANQQFALLQQGNLYQHEDRSGWNTRQYELQRQVNLYQHEDRDLQERGRQARNLYDYGLSKTRAMIEGQEQIDAGRNRVQELQDYRLSNMHKYDSALGAQLKSREADMRAATLQWLESGKYAGDEAFKSDMTSRLISQAASLARDEYMPINSSTDTKIMSSVDKSQRMATVLDVFKKDKTGVNTGKTGAPPTDYNASMRHQPESTYTTSYQLAQQGHYDKTPFHGDGQPETHPDLTAGTLGAQTIPQTGVQLGNFTPTALAPPTSETENFGPDIANNPKAQAIKVHIRKANVPSDKTWADWMNNAGGRVTRANAGQYFQSDAVTAYRLNGKVYDAHGSLIRAYTPASQMAPGAWGPVQAYQQSGSDYVPPGPITKTVHTELLPPITQQTAPPRINFTSTQGAGNEQNTVPNPTHVYDDPEYHQITGSLKQGGHLQTLYYKTSGGDVFTREGHRVNTYYLPNSKIAQHPGGHGSWHFQPVPTGGQITNTTHVTPPHVTPQSHGKTPPIHPPPPNTPYYMGNQGQVPGTYNIRNPMQAQLG